MTAACHLVFLEQVIGGDNRLGCDGGVEKRKEKKRRAADGKAMLTTTRLLRRGATMTERCRRLSHSLSLSPIERFCQKVPSPKKALSSRSDQRIKVYSPAAVGLGRWPCSMVCSMMSVSVRTNLEVRTDCIVCRTGIVSGCTGTVSICKTETQSGGHVHCEVYLWQEWPVP